VGLTAKLYTLNIVNRRRWWAQIIGERSKVTNSVTSAVEQSSQLPGSTKMEFKLPKMASELFGAGQSLSRKYSLVNQPGRLCVSAAARFPSCPEP